MRGGDQMKPENTPQECRKQAAWVLQVGAWGVRSLVLVAVLALVFTMVNVQVFAAAGHSVSSFEWWIAWLLDPMASITMGTAIVFEGLLAGYGRKEGWLAATKWYAGGCTWLMNIWSSVAASSPAGVLLHSVAPGLVLLLAEAAPRVRRQLAEIVTSLVRQAEKLEAEELARRVAEAERQAKEAADARARQAEEAEAARLAQRQAAIAGEQPQPAKSVSPKPPVRQPASADGDLVKRARPLVSEGLGRQAIARQLGITEHQARQAIDAIKTEQQRPALHAVAAGER